MLTVLHLLQEAQLTRNKREDWRYMAPFFLLVLLFLLLVWRFFGPPLSSGSTSSCREGTGVYQVEKGDTCWGIAQRNGVTVDVLREVNGALDCERLRVGMGSLYTCLSR